MRGHRIREGDRRARRPIPFLRKGSREHLEAQIGTKKLPSLRLADGTVLTHSRAILSWIGDQNGAGR